MSDSLAEAGAKLGLSVPAVTQSVKNLESELGIELLNRKSYRATLNHYGECLAQHANNIMSEIEDAKKHLQKIKHSEENQLRITVAPALTNEFLSKAINNLRRQMPDANVQLSILNSDPLKILSEGQSDIVISPVFRNQDTESFLIEPFIKMEIDIIASKNHPATKIKQPSLKELAQFHWLVPSVSGPPFEVIQEMFLENGASIPNSIQQMPLRMMMLNMMKKGEYLAAFPNSAILFPDKLENTEKIAFNSQRYGWTFYIIQRKNSLVSLTQKSFIEEIKNSAEKYTLSPTQ